MVARAATISYFLISKDYQGRILYPISVELFFDIISPIIKDQLQDKIIVKQVKIIRVEDDSVIIWGRHQHSYKLRKYFQFLRV